VLKHVDDALIPSHECVSPCLLLLRCTAGGHGGHGGTEVADAPAQAHLHPKEPGASVGLAGERAPGGKRAPEQQPRRKQVKCIQLEAAASRS
jgi:hypothetical protein